MVFSLGEFTGLFRPDQMDQRAAGFAAGFHGKALYIDIFAFIGFNRYP